MYLSQHFSLAEFTTSREAARRGIDNSAPRAVLPNLARLAKALETIREQAAEGPILVNSGYRCPELNAVVGGSSQSNHMYGLAADIHCPKMSARRLFDRIRKAARHETLREVLQWDECLLECESWVHFAVPAFRDEPDETIRQPPLMKTLEGRLVGGKMTWKKVSQFVVSAP